MTQAPLESTPTPISNTVGQLTLVAVTLGGLSILLAAFVVWGIIALPLGIASTVLALIVRSRIVRSGQAMPQLATIALVLGPVGTALAAAAILAVALGLPFLGGTISNSADTVQKYVQTDLNTVNNDLTRRMDQINHSQELFQKDVATINSDISQRFSQLDKTLTTTSKSIETLQADTKELRTSVGADVRSVRTTTDELTKTMKGLEDKVTAIQKQVDYLCTHSPSTCP
ncbi:MAG: hypothetical protein F2903_04130 [Actinobacteria bacterium]|uniref:Unannotated protein n=1 Tax=freshwater metagenome TaxID=449393 RepID=A0A6J6ZQ05_9ZZZZ|nr:hypothetical protein [Actinomycetota bacterium]MSX09847.1 hypothetical protein [Actinomycetota bacterium]MSX67804.1 hypothetical protein [Actinomycetota bacterium]